MGTEIASSTTFKSYIAFWIGQLISLLGSSIAQFVIIWWITLETGSALYLSIATLAGLGPQVILTPFAGTLADRWNRKWLIAGADFLQAFVTLGLIILFWVELAAYWIVIVLLTFRGIFQAFHSPVTAAIIPVMVPREQLSRINGIDYFLNGFVRLSAPVIAALLLQLWKIYEILWIDVFTFIIAIIPLILIKIPDVRQKREKTSFRHEFGEGMNYIRKTPGLLPLIITSTILNFTVTPLSTLLPYFILFDHFGDETNLALISAFMQGGMLLGGIIMAIKQKFSNRIRVAFMAIFGVYIGYTLLALTPTGLFWFMALGALFATIWIPIANVSMQTILQTTIPLDLQGRVVAVLIAMSVAANPLGMIISGVGVEFIGTVNLFIACIILGLLTLAVSWFFTNIRSIEQNLSVPQPQKAPTSD